MHSGVLKLRHKPLGLTLGDLSQTRCIEDLRQRLLLREWESRPQTPQGHCYHHGFTSRGLAVYQGCLALFLVELERLLWASYLARAQS